MSSSLRSGLVFNTLSVIRYPESSPSKVEHHRIRISISFCLQDSERTVGAREGRNPFHESVKKYVREIVYVGGREICAHQNVEIHVSVYDVCLIVSVNGESK